MKYFVCIFFVLLVSCSKKQDPIDKSLINFKSRFLAELGSEDYDKLLVKTNSKLEAKYLDDVIFVTTYVESNACGNYIGNIRIKNDSILLVYKLVSEEVCSSTSIEKLTYIIDNPKEKKYKFSMSFE